jgi:hypothetical protein
VGGPEEAAVAAASDHEHLGAIAGLKQHPRRMTIAHNAAQPVGLDGSEGGSQCNVDCRRGVDIGTALWRYRARAVADREFPEIRASISAPSPAAIRPAQRSASTEDAEPSTPTTIRRRSLLPVCVMSSGCRCALSRHA